MTCNRINNYVSTTIINIIFWFIKRIIEPFCTVDVCTSILYVLCTPSIQCKYSLSQLLPKFKCCLPNKTPLPDYKIKSEIKSTKLKIHQEVVCLLILPLLLLLATCIMALLLLLLVSSVFSLKITTTIVASIHVPPFIVDILDIKKPKLKLNPTTFKLKSDLMHIKNPRTKNRFKDPLP